MKDIRNYFSFKIMTLVVVGGVIGLPLLWMFLLSTQPTEAIVAGNFVFSDMTLEHYANILSSESEFPLWLFNSFQVAIAVTISSLVLVVPAGFAIMALSQSRTALISRMALLAYMLPPIMLLIPLVILFQWLGIDDSNVRFFLGQLAFVLPLGLWLAISMFRNFPVELIESALLDGANNFNILVGVVIPAVFPGIVGIAVLTFALSWSDYLFASVLLSGNENKTIPVGLYDLYHAAAIDWGVLMAACTLTVVPIILLLPFAIGFFIDRWRI